MASDSNEEETEHVNQERTVRCPVESCDESLLARGVHLHVRRTSDDEHGQQGEVPDGVTFDNLETVGTEEVTMDYPSKRENEDVARMCPYCERPFRGKHGVMIHLGQVAGRKNHPKDGPQRHDPDDFAIVHVDENENIVKVVEDTTLMPSSEQRVGEISGEPNTEEVGKGSGLDAAKVKEYIQELRDDGLHDEADRAERRLLR